MRAPTQPPPLCTHYVQARPACRQCRQPAAEPPSSNTVLQAPGALAVGCVSPDLELDTHTAACCPSVCPAALVLHHSSSVLMLGACRHALAAQHSTARPLCALKSLTMSSPSADAAAVAKPGAPQHKGIDKLTRRHHLFEAAVSSIHQPAAAWYLLPPASLPHSTPAANQGLPATCTAAAVCSTAAASGRHSSSTGAQSVYVLLPTACLLPLLPGMPASLPPALHTPHAAG